MTRTNRIILGVLSSLAVGTAGFILVAYVRTGRRDQDSPLIPEVIEKRIDRLVAWLDERFGKDWVDRGMDSVQEVLSTTGPGLLVQFLEPVFKAEVKGRQKQWTGAEKHSYATNRINHN